MNDLSTHFQIDYEITDLTPRALAEQIIGRLEKAFSIELMPLFKKDTLTERQRIVLFKDTLCNGIFHRAEAENLADFYLSPQSLTDREEMDYLKAETGDETGASAIDLVPLLALAEKDAELIKTFRGEDLKDYLFTLTKRFENIANSKSVPQVVAGLISGGVLAIGVAFAEITAKQLAEGAAISGAIRAGILGVGLRVVITLAVVVLVVLLLYLFLGNPKKILGMVINQTAEDFVVRNFKQSDGDLYVNAGEIKNFMEDSRDGLGSAKVQLKRMLSTGKEEEDQAVFAGLYLIDKKPGIFGAEGLALFSSLVSDLRFAHLFASPYTRDNGTNMAFVPGKDSVEPGKLFAELYPTRQVRVTVDNGSFELASTVNSARGGVVGCIASIKAKTA